MSKAGKPIWPKVPPGFVRAVLAGHSALGLAFAALIYLVCFSGTVAVYTHEFQRWERPAYPVIDKVEPAAIQAAVVASVAAYGKSEHIFINLPEPESPRLRLYLDQGDKDLELVADQHGRLIGSGDTPWTEFMTRLHINLHLPQTWGIFVVGLTGVALLSSLISGVLAHPRVFRDAFHLRWGGSKRLQEADLHNRIGIWALPFHVIISLTGALLGLTTIIVGVLALAVFKGDTDKAYALFLPPHPADNPAAAPLPNIPAAYANLQKLVPGGSISYIGLEHPGEAGAGILMYAGLPDRISRGDSYSFDREGKPLNPKGKGSENLGANIISSMSTLHFGWFAGWPMKVAYGLLGAGTTVVTSSGVAIWLARRRAKGRPAPRWERVWIATIWSQPAAYALSALAAVLAPPLPPLAVWGVGTLIAFATAVIWTPAAISRRLRLIAAGLIAAVVAAHTAVWWGQVVDPVAWISNASLLALAGLLAATVFPPLARPAVESAPAPVAAE